jgi:hypothetical protein
MEKRLFRAFLFAAVLAAALSMGSARAAEAQEPLAGSDPAGATCYHFPLITVCCDGGGCYIVR